MSRQISKENMRRMLVRLEGELVHAYILARGSRHVSFTVQKCIGLAESWTVKAQTTLELDRRRAAKRADRRKRIAR